MAESKMVQLAIRKFEDPFITLWTALDIFQQQFAQARVLPQVYDVTNAFIASKYNPDGSVSSHPPISPEHPNIHEQAWCGPQSFYFGADTSVFAYIIKNARLLVKYQRDSSGRLIRDDNKKLVQYPLTEPVYTAICSLCVKPVASTTYHEIADVLRDEESVHGFTRKALKRIDKQLSYHGFDPASDSAIFIAQKAGIAPFRAQLSAYWLTDVIKNGADLIPNVSEKEALLMEKVLDPKLLAYDKDAIVAASYMYPTANYVPASSIFLAIKCLAYRHAHERNRGQSDFKRRMLEYEILGNIRGSRYYKKPHKPQ